MISINTTTLSGNLTRDAILRTASDDTGVLDFTIAVTDSRKNQQTGEWEDYPNFIECTLFGKLAHALSRKLTKGTRVCVQGKLRFSQWMKDDEKRSKVSVIVKEIEVISSKEAAENDNSMTYNVYDEDIPF